ncbi:UNVERIFIED_CONTAM: Senp1 [Trichonephila clavipes]
MHFREENEEPVTDPRCKREILEQPVNEFLEKYYKPYQQKTATTPKPVIDHKDIFTDKDDEVQVMDVEMPSYKPKPRSKPDFFSPEWIKELKSVITEETEQRLQMVTAQEQKLERYRLRREGKLAARGIPLTKTLPVEEEFPEITPEMEAIIMDAFDVVNKNASGDLVQLEDCTCSRNDLLTLSGLNWLNDCVINFYFKLIKQRNKESNGKLPAVYVFSSYFFPALKTRGEHHVMRWTRKQDIFSHDLLFVPLHFGMHWALCVVDNRVKTIRYYDSMHGTDEDCLRTILNFLVAEMKGKKNQILNPDSYTLEIVKDIPQQMNGSDCGMFSLKYAEYLSRDAPITFTQEHMQYFRRRMVVEIVEKKLFNQVV